MAEVGSWSSMTSNHEIVCMYIHVSTVKSTVKYLAFEPLFIICSVYSYYRVGLMYHAVTFHEVDTQMKSMHKQEVGERSEPHSLYLVLMH